MMKKTVYPLILGAASAGQFTADLEIKKCTKAGGCVPEQKRVALDADSLATEGLVQSSGDTLKLSYHSAVGGPRVYLIGEKGVNKNEMFKLNGQEFTFDVELSTMKCGFNAALYFVGMTENDGEAEGGVKYCDAQAVAGVFCAEMDIMEANTEAQQFTPHGCVNKCASYTEDAGCKKGQPGICDNNGCGYNPFRYGKGSTWTTETNNVKFHGPGPEYDLDTTKRFTVVTQFQMEAGALKAIHRFYMQNGVKVELPPSYVDKPTDGTHKTPDNSGSITSPYCTNIYDRWTGDEAAFPQMGTNMENGMVLAMSAWYDAEVYPLTGSQTGMSWLDGENRWGNGITKTGPCHESTHDSGGPYFATFSNIRVGEIGSTLGPTPPTPPTPAPPPTPPSPPRRRSPAPRRRSPTPPTPAPTPGGHGQCCYVAGCKGCSSSPWCWHKANCEGSCGGTWCPGEASENSVVV